MNGKVVVGSFSGLKAAMDEAANSPREIDEISFISFDAAWNHIKEDNDIGELSVGGTAEFVSQYIRLRPEEIRLMSAQDNIDKRYIFIDVSDVIEDEQSPVVFCNDNGTISVFVPESVRVNKFPVFNGVIDSADFECMFGFYAGISDGEKCMKDEPKEPEAAPPETTEVVVEESKIVKACIVVTTIMAVAIGSVILWDRFRP